MKTYEETLDFVRRALAVCEHARVAADKGIGSIGYTQGAVGAFASMLEWLSPGELDKRVEVELEAFTAEGCKPLRLPGGAQ